MINLIFIFCIAIQLTSAQIVSYVPRNGQVHQQGSQIKNGPNNIPSNAQMLHLSRPAPNNVQLSNLKPSSKYNPIEIAHNAQKFAHAQNINKDANGRTANAQITNADIANARMTNAQIANNAHAKFTNAQTPNFNIGNDRMADVYIANNANARLTNAQIANKISANLANGQNTNTDFNARLANTQNANAEMNKLAFIEAAKNINDQMSKAELANNFLNTEGNVDLMKARMQANANWNKENINMDFSKLDKNAISTLVNANLAKANIAKVNPATLWALNHLASLNGNMATFNMGDGGQMLTISSGSPNSPPFGIQFLAEALEVGGTVSVNGQIPIFGTVAVNGNVPTDGTASVKYSSARKVES